MRMLAKHKVSAKLFGLTALSFCLVLVCAAGALAEKKKYAIAGAGVGQSAYIQAAALADFVNTHSQKINLTPQTTRGYVHNARLVNSGSSDFGLCGTTVIYPAMLGTEQFKDHKCENLRAVINSGDSLHSWVSFRKTGIKTIKDMAGKRINLGAPGSNTRYIAELTLKAYGILDKVDATSLGFGGAAAALRDGEIDAWAAASAPPVPAIIENFTDRDDTFLVELEEAMIKKIMSEHPPFVKVKVPANTYKGQTKPVNCLGYPAYLLVNKNVPDDVVYEVLKLVTSPEGRKRLITISDKWKTLEDEDVPKFEGMANIKLKLHTGAEKFWKEKGLKIPAAVAAK